MDLSINFSGNSNDEKFIDIIAQKGFSAIDYNVGSGDFKTLTQEFTKKVHKHYKMIKDSGMYVAQTHLDYYPGHLPPIGNGTYNDFEDFMLPLFIRGIELSGEMNSRTAVLHSYFEADRQKSREGNIELITKLIPYLEKNNVILSLENIYGPDYSDIHLSTAEDLLFYIDYFKSPYLGTCLDTGHAFLRKQDAVLMLEKLGNSLNALHINSNSGDHDIHSIPYTMSYVEKVDWEKFVQVLKSIDYKGTFNFELFIPKKFTDKAKEAFYTVVSETANDLINRGI